MSEHSALAKAICHDVVEANISQLPRHQQFLIVREKVDAILEAYPEYDYRKLEARVKDIDYNFPESLALIKDSGLWTAYDETLTQVVYEQGLNESFADFMQRIISEAKI
jgi:hypothetical protein